MGMNSLGDNQKKEGNQESIDIRKIVINGLNSPEYSTYQKEIESIEKHGTFLDFDNGKEDELFSLIDEKDKYTQRLCDCTGVVLFGKEKESNRIISCISHVSLDDISFNLINVVGENEKWNDQKVAELDRKINEYKVLLEDTDIEELE